MIIAIKQPYFLPYIGFWQEVKAVDKYVFFDDVNYINRGWINRNYILVNGMKFLFTLSLKEASQNKHINEIEISDNFERLRKTIEFAYKKAPFFCPTMELLNKILTYENRNLSRFVGNSIEEISNYLGFSTSFLYSSEIEKDERLHKQDKLIDICERLNADAYYDSTGAITMYDKPTFNAHNINLSFVKSSILPYKQFNNEFVPGLSIIDVLMFNDINKINEMLSAFELL